MTEIQTFEVEIPVSANQRLIRSKNGSALISSKKYRTWFESAVYAIRAQRSRPTIAGRIGVTITMHYPDNRRRDLDNSLKGFFDACTHAGVWADDSQIDNLHIIRSDISRPGRLIARVWEI